MIYHNLYNDHIQPDVNILNNIEILIKESDPDLKILKSEVSDAIQTLKEWKSLGIDNIPSEIIKDGGSSITKILTQICQTSWDNKILPTQWTQSLVIMSEVLDNLTPSISIGGRSVGNLQFADDTDLIAGTNK